MSTTVILGAARTPVGKLGGGLSTLTPPSWAGSPSRRRSSARTSSPSRSSTWSWARSSRPARARSPRARRRSRPASPRRSRRRPINKVCASGIRAAGLLDASIRAGDLEVGVGGGMESMSKAPVHAPARPLRLPHGRRQGDRRDDPRRPHQPVHRQAHGPRGVRGRRRARDDPRRHGPLGAALPRARDRGHRRGPPARGDRPGDDQGPKGDTVGRGRRGARAATRRSSRSPSCRDSPSRTGTHTAGNSPGRQRRRRRARARLRRVGRGQRQGGAGHDRRPGGGRRRLPLPRPHARPRRPRRRSTRPACSRATSTCGRSTRPSPRSR